MADTQTLKKIYRRLASIKAGSDLAAQKTWLEQTFVKRADDADEGGFQAASDSFEGASFAGMWKGSSAEDRSIALLDALEEIDAEIAAADADEVAPSPIACLIPRVITAPR